MRCFVLVVSLLVCACTLDASSKPECLVDNDCYYPRGSHCVEQVCQVNALPVATPDVFYVPSGTDLSKGPVKLVGDVIANDVDPDGDPLKVQDATYVTSGAGYAYRESDTTVRIDVQKVPATFAYRVADGGGTNPDKIQIAVAWLDTAIAVEVEAATTTSLAPRLATLSAAAPGSIELITPPAHGSLSGTIPDVTYAPESAYCGSDSVLYRVHAANGTFDVAITLHVGLLLEDESGAMEIGTPRTFDVFANDRAGLELVSTSETWATVNTAKDALIAEPPTDAAHVYSVRYTARDSRGCEGTATLTLDVGFPTSVVVGAGLTGDAFDGVLSHDGRFLAFTSADATLVANDTNAASDVFVLDLQTHTVERVSVASDGMQANEGSSSPTISADGRYVAFVSRATNLVAADTKSVEDIYLHDRLTNATTLVSVSIDGTGSDQPSLTPHISDSGARIVFASGATRVVASDSNDAMDIFVRDLGTNATTRVSVTGSGAQVPYASQTRPRISGNGRYVALSCWSSLDGSNSSGAFLVDTAGGSVSRIDSSTGDMDIDETGRFIIHADSQVTLIDRVVDNQRPLGNGTFPSLSADGRYTTSVNYSGLGYVIGVGNGTIGYTANVDRAGKPVYAAPLRRPEISGDGRWIVFSTSEWPGYAGRFVIVRVWNRAFL
jgi:hypothetical protein